MAKVWIIDKNYELGPIERCICPIKYWDLIDHRIFPTLKEFQDLMMALGRGNSQYALSHGMACPADTKNAIKRIESLEKYQ